MKTAVNTALIALGMLALDTTAKVAANTAWEPQVLAAVWSAIVTAAALGVIASQRLFGPLR